MENWRKILPIPSGSLEVPLLLKFESPDKCLRDTMEEFEENFYSFNFAGDLVANDEDEEIYLDPWENSNENDESEINEKDKVTVTLDDPTANKTKAVSAVIIDWYTTIKSNKKFKNGYFWWKFSSGKTDKIIFQVTNKLPQQKCSPARFSLI